MAESAAVVLIQGAVGLLGFLLLATSPLTYTGLFAAAVGQFSSSRFPG